MEADLPWLIADSLIANRYLVILINDC